MTDLPQTEPMPVLFIGHGNPMNAITQNPYRAKWQELGASLTPPTAILCISAHWQTIDGTLVTMAEPLRTIHDFGGFPPALYAQEYPAPTALAAAKETIAQIPLIEEDQEWGLDHGSWCVLMAMFPKADIPVYQLSLDVRRSVRQHYDLARQLAFLRRQGVLIIGSGNIVHNLRLARSLPPYDWAIEFDHFVKENLENDTPDNLIDYQKFGTAAMLSVPTDEHYLPMIYALALRDSKDELSFFNEGFDMSSISMRSFMFKPS